jgi:hypothetical protein
MDHSCYKCGHSVDDGKPFCAECGAPQIRVAMPEVLAPAGAGNVSPGKLHEFSLDSPSTSEPLTLATLSRDVEWRRALWASAIAAAISIVLMSLQLVFPLLAALGAGVLAVILYHRRDPLRLLTTRAGAQVGAVTGLFISTVTGVCFAVVMAVLRSGGPLHDEVIERLQQSATGSNGPQMQAMLDLLKTPDGLTKFTLTMIGFFLLSIAASSLAGALTGAFLSRRKRP